MVRGLLAVGILLIGLPIASGLADEVDELKGGPIWGYCESYFVRAKDRQVQSNSYAMRDLSLEFLELAKTLKPRTKKEAYLFIECVNLANGNAVGAQDAIQKVYDEDDEFFEDLRIDATNNSNASQHKYVSSIDGKYDFKNQLEGGKHIFEARLKKAQAEAMIQAAQILGIAAGGLAIGSLMNSGESSNALASAATFAAFAAASTQIYAVATNAPAVAGSGTGRQNAVQTNLSNITLAPEAKAGSAASAANVEYSDPPNEPPTKALTPAAPHVTEKCVTYSMADEYQSVAHVYNNCPIPVVFFWCWMQPAQKSCEPQQQTGIIEPKKRASIAGPGAKQPTSAMYVVCDMSIPGQVCKL